MDALKEYWKSKTDDEIRSALSKVSFMLFVIEFCTSVAVYAILKIYASLFWAECWMIGIFAWTLKSSIDLTIPIVITKLKDNRTSCNEKIETKEDTSKDQV